jgi:hypothetical protein
MFCREIVSFEKSPAMLDHFALALHQEGSDAAGPLKCGSLRRTRRLVGKSDMIEQRARVGSGCDLRNRSEIASRQMKEIN